MLLAVVRHIKSIFRAFYEFSNENLFMAAITSIGIDLGTTNSVLAYTNLKLNGDIVSKVVDIERPVDMYSGVGNTSRLTTMKKTTLPSCVYYIQEQNYKPLVGDFAKMQYSIRPHLVAKSIKSQMGKPLAENLSPDIPDKTPAEISSRILKHMISKAEKALKINITDAIITVPANFDSSMCQATREAARLAGIQVTYPNGTEKPILLSEPNAVIYDLFNLIRNGEIPDTVLDLSQTRRVVVFDLGGGTLDITMHEIKRRTDQNDGTLKVSEIATNRYTLLGGDNFDEVISEEMFRHYLNQYSSYPQIVDSIKRQKNEVMPTLRRLAEELKIEMNETYSASDSQEDEWWRDEDEGNTFSPNSPINCTGYGYDDEFTRKELEDILSVFMANELNFEDYKRIDEISNKDNIIFPILDVLDKASKKLNTPDVKVDAVIVNGGMSKFYMVTERLTKFFGFQPIVVLDPDLAVARGAAVYHYLMTSANHSELADDMISVGNGTTASVRTRTPRQIDSHIKIGIIKPILNDALYLGTKDNNRMVLIPTGTELPFDSEIKECLIPAGKNDANTSQVVFPIQSQNLDGTFRTISHGIGSFRSSYPAGTVVAFQVHMDASKSITMEAWIKQEDSDMKFDLVKVDIKIDNNLTPEQRRISKVLAPNGSRINIKETLNNFITDCKNFESKRKKNAAKLRQTTQSICVACNRSEFAPIIIDALYTCNSEEAKMRLFTISRKIMSDWTDRERKEIAKICIGHLGGLLNGLESTDKRKINSNTQAIYALSVCGTPEQLEKLRAIHDKPEYLQACIYAHGVTKTCVDWLIERFEISVEQVLRGQKNDLQNTAYFMGAALNDNHSGSITSDQVQKIIKKLLSLISGNLIDNPHSLSICILAVGWICDQRNQPQWEISEQTIQEIKDALEKIDSMYELRTQKAREVVYKLIEGQILTKEEEALLLQQIENEEAETE